jgi:hypothetical protein
MASRAQGAFNVNPMVSTPAALPSVALVLALAAAGACSREPASDEPAAHSPPAIPAGRAEVAAPIEAAELVVRESQPPRYAVKVVSGLPSGCAKFARVDVSRDGYVVNVGVWNTVPSDPTVACTMIYGTVEHTIELGAGFNRGESYAVHVNGERRLAFTPP